MFITPNRVDVKRGICRGWVMSDRATWRVRETKLQDGVVYDAMYLADLHTHRTDYKRLMAACKRFGVPVFNQPLPKKDELYEGLQASGPTIATLLPRTVLRIYPQDLTRLLQTRVRDMGTVWFKPTVGSGGRNMLRVKYLEDDMYSVRGERFYGQHIASIWSSRKLVHTLKEVLTRRPYMLQEDIKLLQTKDGRKVDFRVTLARGEQAIWAVTGVTARLGRVGRALTNFHAGGSIQSLSHMQPETRRFLKELEVSEAEIGRITNAAIQVARHLSRDYPRLGVLGVDVGLSAKDRKVYVYDINSRPGRDILTDEEVETTMNQVARYAAYLYRTTRTQQ